MWYSVEAPTGEASTEPNQKRASPKGPALFLFVHHSRKHPAAESSPAIPIYPAPPKSTLTLSRPLRCLKLSAGKCTHPLTPALLSARAAPGRGPYPNRSTALTPGTEAPGAAGRQPAQAPLFLLGGAALAFCPCLLRQGAHPEGTGPLPWPVGPAGPRAGLARRQSDAAQLGPLYDGGAKLGRLLKRGRARRVAPAGLYPPWGASARPLGWRPGALRGRGCLRARAPPSTAAVPCCPVGTPIVARHQGSARGVHALPLTQRGPYTQAPASSPAAALRRAVPLILCGPGP